MAPSLENLNVPQYGTREALWRLPMFLGRGRTSRQNHTDLVAYSILSVSASC